MRTKFFKLISIKVLVVFMFVFISIIRVRAETKSLSSLSLEELMDIEVYSASKSMESIEDIPGSVTIITRDEIEKYGYLTLDEILKNVPGMFLLDNTESLFIGIRGNSGGGVQFLLNGIPWHNSLAKGIYSTDINKFNVPVQSIDRIEIIRGPMSVIYGNNAFLGTINIITNDIEAEETMASISVGNNGVSKFFARFGQYTENGFFVINGGFYKTDGLSGLYADMLDEEQMEFLHPSAVERIDGEVPKDNGSIDMSIKYKNLVANFRYNKMDYGFYPTSVGLGGKTHIKLKTLHSSLVYDVDITEKTSFRATGIVSTEKYYIPNFFFILPSVKANQTQTSRRSEIEFNIIHKEDKFEFVSGYRFRLIDDLLNHFYFELQPDMLPLADFDNNIDAIRTHELFGQISFELNDKWQLITGLRYLRLPAKYSMTATLWSENIEEYRETPIDDRNPLTVRMAFIYKVNDYNQLKFLVGTAAQDRDEFYFSEPEEITTYEVNEIYTLENLQISTSIFYNQISRIIQRSVFIDSENGFIIDQVDNSGEWNSYGFEMIAQYYVNENFRVSGSLTLQKTEDNLQNVEVGYSPNVLAKLKAEYTKNKISFGVNGYYVSSMKAGYELVESDSADPFCSELVRIGDDVSGYLILGANVRYKKDNGFFVELNGSNLLDKKFRYPANEMATMRKGLIGMGRVIVFTAGCRF